MLNLSVGDVVYYIPYKGCDSSYYERGIVKSFHETNPNIVFVVYACGGDWGNYHKYTGVSTDISKLTRKI